MNKRRITVTVTFLALATVCNLIGNYLFFAGTDAALCESPPFSHERFVLFRQIVMSGCILFYGWSGIMAGAALIFYIEWEKLEGNELPNEADRKRS